ncbi:MAG: deoxyribose-phosphate aldolase [Chitinophagaceae bacterium]|jgi:deoxyribose-phosphate aldolase
MTAQELAKYIDHSLLHPTMTDKDLDEGLAIAKKYGTATVCIKPYAVKYAAEVLKDTGIGVCTVIGFPHGSNTTDLKVIETIEACRNGATEIDMVVNVGKVLGGDWDYVEHEIEQINNICFEHNAILKVIFENDYLKDEQKIKLCEICSKLHVAFVKTSTGYGYVKQDNGMFLTKGATLPDLILMRKHSAPTVQIKAAGGIRNLKDMLAAIEVGATRIGATATAVIIEEFLGNNSVESSISGY